MCNLKPKSKNTFKIFVKYPSMSNYNLSDVLWNKNVSHEKRRSLVLSSSSEQVLFLGTCIVFLHAVEKFYAYFLLVTQRKKRDTWIKEDNTNYQRGVDQRHGKPQKKESNRNPGNKKSL
jgi:hypothetical protein